MNKHKQTWHTLKKLMHLVNPNYNLIDFCFKSVNDSPFFPLHLGWRNNPNTPSTNSKNLPTLTTIFGFSLSFETQWRSLSSSPGLPEALQGLQFSELVSQISIPPPWICFIFLLQNSARSYIYVQLQLCRYINYMPTCKKKKYLSLIILKFSSLSNIYLLLSRQRLGFLMLQWIVGQAIIILTMEDGHFLHFLFCRYLVVGW